MNLMTIYSKRKNIQSFKVFFGLFHFEYFAYVYDENYV